MNPVQMEDMPCPLGCVRCDDVVTTGGDRLNRLPGEFTVVRCRSCGLMRTNPRPTTGTIGFYYPDTYSPYLDTRVRPSFTASSSRIRTMLKSLAKRVFVFNTERLPPLPPGRMLEAGCASGAFLHRMALGGWQVEGIEFSAEAARAASRLGYHVHAGPLETAPTPDEPFDLIVGWMVLEHLHDPIGGLVKLEKWAKPDAWLVLSVPNAESLEFHLFKEKWYALQVPTHLYHFTTETVRRALRAAGWEVETIYHQRILSNLIASTGYVLRDKGYVGAGQKLIDFPEHAGRWHYLLYPLAWLLSLSGQTGRMTVWARKADR